MMKRRIIEIDQEKCNGCGACVDACHEGAIGMVNGKAALLRDDYCDGLGDCLPNCPMDAISFVEREAAAYDEKAVQENMRRRKEEREGSSGCPGQRPAELRSDRGQPAAPQGGCPGQRAAALPAGGCPGQRVAQFDTSAQTGQKGAAPSQLRQWPVQIQLVPVNAPYFNGADLLVAADCTGYAYGSLHDDFMAGRVTLIGCPKLDPVDYTEKLTQILENNDIQSVTMVRMQVPCCGGLERAVRDAIKNSHKDVPLEVVTISADGRIIGRAS